MTPSIVGVVDVTLVRGEQSKGTVDLVVEVPHGATKAIHFDALRADLKGPFPDDLRDFFFVNTDVGAPEAALALAHHTVRIDPKKSALVLRCLIPRTFIDCNRIIDESTVPTTSSATGMTPGIVRYVTDAGDLKLLIARYSAYRACVTKVLGDVLGRGGRAVMLHSYAPRSVDVPVDEKIVQRLHAAYSPDVVNTWPLRPEIDLITKTPEGVVLADPAVVDAMRAVFTEAGLKVTDSEAYPLHPSSLAHTFASRWPKQTLCLEIRRDLLVKEFTPFQEMVADDAKVDRISAFLARALRT